MRRSEVLCYYVILTRIKWVTQQHNKHTNKQDEDLGVKQKHTRIININKNKCIPLAGDFPLLEFNRSVFKKSAVAK